jgi:hypothetical protein
MLACVVARTHVEDCDKVVVVQLTFSGGLRLLEGEIGRFILRESPTYRDMPSSACPPIVGGFQRNAEL